MWNRFFEVRKSVIDGSDVKVPVLRSDDGAEISPGGILPEGVRLINYRTGALHLKIRIHRYDGAANMMKETIVSLTLAMSGLKNDGSYGVIYDDEIRAKIMNDLSEALPGLDAIMDAGQPPIGKLVFS